MSSVWVRATIDITIKSLLDFNIRLGICDGVVILKDQYFFLGFANNESLLLSYYNNDNNLIIVLQLHHSSYNHGILIQTDDIKRILAIYADSYKTEIYCSKT